MTFLGELTDDSNERIIDRILQKYANRKELSLIANVLNSKFDVALLKRYIKSVPFSNISKASLLIFENNNTKISTEERAPY